MRAKHLSTLRVLAREPDVRTSSPAFQEHPIRFWNVFSHTAMKRWLIFSARGLENLPLSKLRLTWRLARGFEAGTLPENAARIQIASLVLDSRLLLPRIGHSEVNIEFSSRDGVAPDFSLFRRSLGKMRKAFLFLAESVNAISVISSQ